ncbi:MAG TPA: DUF4129 domain-containing protein [Gemmatimonadaceae bacterium]|nr:DUF4129 domain-containing protein [Gemmatimonadaceae bacterium]
MPLPQLPQTPLDPATVRDSVRAVFRDAAYDRTLRETLWDRISEWFGELFRRFREAAGDQPAFYWTTVVVLAAVAAAAAGRLIYLAVVRRDLSVAGRGGAAGRGGRRAAVDPRLRAQELAAAGDYTEAAHALYRALLEAISQRERVRLHPSKTVGDYVRDLRARSSSLFGRFRDFARSYEVVVYGLGVCDRDRYERLFALASGILSPRADG